MSMRFPYKLVPMWRPLYSLGGRTVRPRALVNVGVQGPSNTVARRMLLDTGADECIFPDSVANRVGVDLNGTPTGSATAAGLGPLALRYAQVTLRLTDGQEFRQWSDIVGFTSAPLIYPLLDFAGCLQYFWAHFMGDREEVERTVNSLYPGT